MTGFDIDKMLADAKERRCVRCPKCDYVEDNSCSLSEAELITYWGEDGPKVWHCPNCEAIVQVEEIVTREYEVKGVVTSYFAVQVTGAYGKKDSTFLYDEDYLDTREDCERKLARRKESGEISNEYEAKKGKPITDWGTAKIIEIKL